MNIQKKFRTPALKSRMVFRLWSGMMMLVLLGIGFMWMFHIYLFEQNYVKAALTETQKRLEPVMDDLSTQDLADDPRLLSRMSHMAGGELILMNQQGKLIEMYSIGHKINIQEHQDEQIVLNVIVRRQEFQELLKGTPYRIVDRHQDRIFGFEMGFPVTYQGETCFVILHNMVMLKTTLDLNRRQLILLTILLTVTASVLALLVSRHFTRPVFQIKDAVDRLTRDDFSARPELKRDDELGQLSDSVEKLGQKLQQVDILRKEVIANVSHELRSPLAVIGGYAELVRDININPLKMVYWGYTYPQSHLLFNGKFYSESLTKAMSNHSAYFFFFFESFLASFSGRIVGKRITSRIDLASVRSITRRSIPIPSPPVGGIPYSRA